MNEIVELVVKSYGVIGIILLSPMVALKFLWDHNKKLIDQIQAANDKQAEVSNKRVEDAKAIAEKLMELSSEHAGLSKETNIALERIGDTLTVLANQNGGRLVPRRRASSEDGS